MDSAADWLERRIPDVVSTVNLPAHLAADIDFLAGRTERWIDDPSAIGPALHARALVQAGEMSAARAVLTGIDSDTLSVHGLVAAAWAVSRVGPAPLAESLLVRARVLSGGILHDEIPLGPSATVVGLLLGATGELVGAADSLRAAAKVGDIQAPLWGALARLELARTLRCAEAIGAGEAAVAGASDGPADEADRVMHSARTFFAAGGYASLLARADRIDGDCSDLRSPCQLAGTHPQLGVLLAGASWTVGFGVQPAVTVRTSKGLDALRYIIVNKHRVVPAIELCRMLDGGDVSEIANLTTGDIIAKLDQQGSSRHGEDTNDLAAQLRALFFDDSTRSRITKLLRRTIVKLGKAHRLLGLHLEAAIGTGHACRYEPTGTADVSWQL